MFHARPNVIGMQQLQIGGGGWLTGLDIAPDGTEVCRTDTNGALWFDPVQQRWVQMVTQNNMPALLTSIDYEGGVWDIAIAYSNTYRFYMHYLGYMLRTDDRGKTWTLLSNFAQDTGIYSVAAFRDSDTRLAGQKIAVDPNNADHLVVSSSTGLRRSIDAGANWTLISTASVPVGTALPYGAGLCFDPNGGTTNGRSNVLYAPSFGNGVYKSADCGNTTPTFSKLTAGTGPVNVRHGDIDRTTGTYGGTYYACEATATGAWKWASATWAAISTSGQTATTIACDPNHSGRIVVLCNQNANNPRQSFDAGATFSGPNNSWSPTFPAPGMLNIANDIPWLGWTRDPAFKALGEAKFNKVTGKLSVSEGIGWWDAVFPDGTAGGSFGDLTTSFVAFNWNSRTLGVEQLVAKCIVSPPGGPMLFGVSDRCIFVGANTYSFPATHGPNNLLATPIHGTSNITNCTSIAYCAGKPQRLAAICNTDALDYSSWSDDGGKSWTQFASSPTLDFAGAGGALAINCNDPNNIVWAESTNGFLYSTVDNGATWTRRNPPGVQTTAAPPDIGWGWAAFFNRHPVVADSVLADTFYAYNYMVPAIFKSTDKGATWASVNSTSATSINTGGILAGTDGSHLKLRHTPGKAGHLWVTAGPQGSPGDTNPAASTIMKHSTDGGATWSCPNANVLEVYDLGFGKPSSPGAYPRLWIFGWVSGTQGIHYSDDEGATWTFCATFALPAQWKQTISCIQGNMNAFGEVFAGLVDGAGFARGYFA